MARPPSLTISILATILSASVVGATPLSPSPVDSDEETIDTTRFVANPADFADIDAPTGASIDPVASASNRSSTAPREVPPAKHPDTKRKRKLPQIPAGTVAIPSGCFRMGSIESAGAPSEHPRHEVCVSPFRIDRRPVDQDEFQAAFGTAPWDLCDRATCADPDPIHPAWFVTWFEADSFCRRQGGRLPTEAEFEYAARAGDSGIYLWGDSLSKACQYANLADLSLRKVLARWTAFPCDDGVALIAPVGSRKPNRWGLYDMAGNVWQWTSDWYAEDWYGHSPRQDPKGPPLGTGKVMRGGSWMSGPTGGRVAYRDGFAPGERYTGAIGFRCVYPPGP